MKMLINVEELEKYGSRDMIPFECENCNEEFSRTKNLVCRAIKGTRTISCCTKYCAKEKRSKESKTTKPCKRCGKDFESYILANQLFCSNRCANSVRGPMKEETKIKIRKVFLNSEKFKKANEARIIIVNSRCPQCGKEIIQRKSKAKKYCSKKCVSEVYSNNCKSRKDMCKNNNRHAGWYESPIAGKVWLESSWEVKVAKILDSANIKWARPKNTFEWIDVLGRSHKYYPDFYLCDYDTYLDPKNPFAIQRDAFKINQVKEKHGIKLYIMTKDQLNIEYINSIIEHHIGANQ